MSTQHEPRIPARERLLSAADELFYDEGIQTVGLDRVIERAGVAKASLYNTFGSKEALVSAYLTGRHTRNEARITAAVERHTDPRERLLAVFDAQAELIASPSFHGCAFMNAGAEAPAGGAVAVATDVYRSWLRGLFAELAADAGCPDPARIAKQLHLIYDGATLAGRTDGDRQDSGAVRGAAEVLLDNALR
jgi:AcrR family transcriptional regulator